MPVPERLPQSVAWYVDELPVHLAHAECIARSTAAALDSPWSVSSEEEAALVEIAQLLGVDNGTSWAALLRELEGVRESPTALRRGQAFAVVGHSSG